MVFHRKQKQPKVPARRRATGSIQEADLDAKRRQQSSQYRRGRTMAGSTKSRLKGADTGALKTATPREKVHQLSYIRRKVGGVLSVVLVVSIVLLVIIWQFSAKADVNIQPSVAVASASIEKYQKDIEAYLSHNPVQRLRFNLDEQNLSEHVVRHNPEVARVSQEGFKALATTSFSVKMRQPIVSWQVDSTQYYVDAEGVSFTKSVYDPPSVTIVDNSGVRHTAGTAIASERFLSFVGRAVSLAQQNNLVVQKVNIPAGTSRQVSFEIKGVSYPVILSIDRYPGEQVEDALRAVNYFKRQQKSPAYVDVRVKGKAFFRE